MRSVGRNRAQRGGEDAAQRGHSSVMHPVNSTAYSLLHGIE
jgi:hypothetical protein